MQFIGEEFNALLAKQFKIGDLGKPYCRVEVDRLAFVPGDVADLTFLKPTAEALTIVNTNINSDGGYTAVTPGGIVFPAVGYSAVSSVTSPFGMRKGRMHKGIDIGCPRGTRIVSVWPGRVSVCSEKDLYTSWGKYVDVDHGNGIITRYAHLSQITVQPGQSVTAGQLLGLSGNTGNVWGATGSYNDPNSARSKGVGAHLHFEVLKNGVQVDPHPYLFGKTQLFSTIQNLGDIVEAGQYVLVPGETIFTEHFLTQNWLSNPNYTYTNNLNEISVVEYGIIPDAEENGFLTVKFATDPSTAAFAYSTILTTHGLLDISYASNFPDNLAEFKIYVNEKLVRRVLTHNANANANKFQMLGNIPLPPGQVKVKFEMRVLEGAPVGMFRIYFFKIREAHEEFQKTSRKDITEALFANPTKYVSKQTAHLSLGRFIYMDTMVLEPVTNVEIDDQFEMEAVEARVILSNPKGLLSPDYSRSAFPETGEDSPWSYFVNGAHVGILSENTPIRIYLGYGNDIMRVFTGLIDKTDVNSLDGTLTISCRNMYKRLMEKVISEEKGYPLEYIPGADNYIDVAPLEDYTGYSLYEQIVYKAQQYASLYQVDDKLILAIAKHETQFGALGAGKPENGGYICGYGVPDSGKLQSQYAGIDMQCKMVAKRIKDAIPNMPVNAQSIYNLWNGGNLGPAYRYASDPNWPNKVWEAYQQIAGVPRLFNGTAAGITYTPDEMNAALAAQNTPWLKSAVVQDLVAHAGLIGWRASAEDENYPDAFIEESYLIEVRQAEGKVVKAVPGIEGQFYEADINSIPTMEGWLNPFVDNYGRYFPAWSKKVAEAIREVLEDTNYRSYCDRFGTYRLEKINYHKPVVRMFTEYDNLMTLNKTIDFSRTRSHLLVGGGSGVQDHFIDSEILIQLKGEVRTAVVNVDWCKNEKQLEEVARRLFWDMKRMARTLQIVIPGEPQLEVLDRVWISDHYSATREIYTIKGIRSTFSLDAGYIQLIDLFWCDETEPIKSK